MNEQMIRGFVEAEMQRLGFAYTNEDGYMVLTAGQGGKRWKMAISFGENRISCYAAYPRQIPQERRAEMLERLNDINAAARFGSYFLIATKQEYMIAYRYDIPIADIYSIAECFEHGLKNTAAAFCARWDNFAGS